MIDLKKLRETPDLFKKASVDKQQDPSLIDEVLKFDEQKRALLSKVEILRAERNKLGKEDLKRGKDLKEDLKTLEENLEEVETKLQEVLLKLPNPALAGVPVGKDENDNVEIKKWGEIPKFSFIPKAHWQLGEDLDLIDTARAAKVSGTRFGYLKNEAVLLELALINFGLKKLLAKGFTPIFPPVMLQKKVMAGLGYNNFGFEETYQICDENLVLVATAEHALVPYFKDEILTQDALPKRLVGFSPAFRREAGSYGKDTKGILRVHQFNKLEMVCLTRPEDSAKEHQFMVEIEEELMQELGLAYQLMNVCSGDLGDPAASKFDINTWFPSENKYRETHSCSNCTDYQARRLNIKYKSKTGENAFVHVLNGTVFSERPILAILENYQKADGSVEVPKVLRPFIGQDTIASVR